MSSWKDVWKSSTSAIGDTISKATKQIKDSGVIDKVADGAKTVGTETSKFVKNGADKVTEGAKAVTSAVEKTFNGRQETVREQIIDGHTVLNFNSCGITLLLPDAYTKIKDQTTLKSLAANFNAQRIETAYMLLSQGSAAIVSLTPIAKEHAMNPYDLQGLVDGIHKSLADDQGLVEAKHGKTKRGYDFIYSIVKTVQDQGGVNYFLRLNLFREEKIIEVYGSFEEQGVTGMREAFASNLAMSAGLIKSGLERWMEDPFDPDFNRGVRKNLAEKEGLDVLFPDNPLTRAHTFLYAILHDALVTKPEETSEEQSETDYADYFVDECKQNIIIVEIEKPSDSDDSAATEKSSESKDKSENKAEKKTKKPTLNDQLHDAVNQYNAAYSELKSYGELLLRLRERSMDLLDNVEKLINSIANRPKRFDVDLTEIQVCKKAFRDVCDFAKTELAAAKKSAIGVGAGIAGGAAVVSLAPTAAMWIATTFGTASTGTAISVLSGAAAKSAAIAWLGGGAIAAGGGGMAAGHALLALSGPIGWGISGVTLLTSIVLFTNKKKKLEKEKKDEIESVLKQTEEVQKINAKLEALVEKTDRLRTALNEQYGKCMNYYGDRFPEISEDGQYQLGALVNNALSLAATLDETVEASE